MTNKINKLKIPPPLPPHILLIRRKAVWPPAPSYLDNPLERPDYSSIGINAPLLEPDSPPPLHLPARYSRPERRHQKIARTQSVGDPGRASSGKGSSKPSAGAGGRVLSESDDLVNGYTTEGKGGMPRVINDFDRNEEVSDYELESGSNVSEEDDIDRYPGGHEQDDNGGLYRDGDERNAEARLSESDFDTVDGVKSPLLFPQRSSTSGYPARPLGSDSDRGKKDGAEKQSRRRRRAWGKGQAWGDVDHRNGNFVGAGGGELQGGAHADDAAVGGSEGSVEPRNDKLEKWFRSPHDHESETASMLSEQPRHDPQQQRLSNAISPSTEAPTARAKVPNGAHGQTNNPGDRDTNGRHPWFSDGVAGDGYVSLTSRLDSDLVHRRGTGDEVHVGGAGEAAATCGGGGWRCGSGGLAMFREQLYEEGRSKGSRGNLASRFVIT